MLGRVSLNLFTKHIRSCNDAVIIFLLVSLEIFEICEAFKTNRDCPFLAILPVSLGGAVHNLSYCLGEDEPARIAGELCYSQGFFDAGGCFSIFRSLQILEHQLLELNPGAKGYQRDQSLLHFFEPSPLRLYSTQARVYIELKLLGSHSLYGANYSFSTCVFANFEKTPAWCGQVPHEKHSPVYVEGWNLKPGQTVVLKAQVDACSGQFGDGDPQKQACQPDKEQVDSFWTAYTFLNTAQVYIRDVKLHQSFHSKKPAFSLRFLVENFDAGADWKICALVNTTVAACLSNHSSLVLGLGFDFDRFREVREVGIDLPSLWPGIYYLSVAIIDKNQKALALSNELLQHIVGEHPAQEHKVDNSKSLFGLSISFTDCKHEKQYLQCMLQNQEWGYYSQNGEDGILQFLLNWIDATGAWRTEGYYVEFGTENGDERNTRLLQERNKWEGLLMDGGYENLAINLHRHFITAENINQLFEKYQVPSDFGVLSIDLDFNDYWVWKAITPKYRPRIVVIEYNSHLPPNITCTVPYKPEGRWDGKSKYFGASLGSLSILGLKKNYYLVYCESHGVNCFFVRKDLIPFEMSDLNSWPGQSLFSININDLITNAYRPPNFYNKGWSYPEPNENKVWYCSDQADAEPTNMSTS